jgi:PEGA domain
MAFNEKSFLSLISWTILAGLIIFFTTCSGCTRYSSPFEITTQPTSTLRGMPAQTPGVTSAATIPISPFSTETPTGTSTQGTGSLIIWSSPPACSVYIDGMYVGDTPTGRDSLTKSVKSSPHTVKITKTGYEDYTQNMYVSVGKSEIITAALSEKTFPYYTLNPTSTFTESFS